VLVAEMIGAPLAAETRPRTLEIHALETALRRVELGVDARKFFLGNHVGAEFRLDLRELGVVLLLVGGESAIEILVCRGGIRRLGFEAVLFGVHGFSL
jgi:hypothetical protein